LLIFTCERCGKQFHVDEHLAGRRGRCGNCKQVMRIPGQAAPLPAAAPAPASTPVPAEPAFRLAPPVAPPQARREMTLRASGPVLREPTGEAHARFELIEDGDAPAMPAPPEVERGLSELAEFEINRKGYQIASGSGRPFFAFFRRRDSRPAGWLTVKWRGMITLALKLLRWIDDWAYLISVPFLVLILFGLALSNRGLVHAGAVVVVLANYGRFWADLLAFFVRPYKDGPLHGLGFLIPPYTVYFLVTRWSHMKAILRRMLTSCIPIVLVVLAYAFFPAVNPAVKDVQGVAAKLRLGTAEVVKEIKAVPEELEQELSSLQKTAKPEPEPQPWD
jgi:hypothetical protein